MKKVLITGLNSYIGNSFEEYIENTPNTEMAIEKISLKGRDWQKKSWADYNTVLHVAGLAHVDVSHADENTKKKYYQINRDLADQAAKKAKTDGVTQFIYLSSIIVYGDSAPIGRIKRINLKTEPAPANFYGDSKLQGERAVLALQSEKFRVFVLRLPMVYGKNSKGNFKYLKNIAEKTPIFPQIENRRSMLYIGNLCELLKIAVESGLDGLFCPQNREVVSTSELVKLIGDQKQKKIKLITGFAPILKVCAYFTEYVNKIFGNLEYEETLSILEWEYRRYSLKESLADMEKNG